MTPLTASGWLWLGWCVFLVGSVLVSLSRRDRVATDDWLVVALSLSWLGWLVAR